MLQTEPRTGWDGAERKRVEAVVETLANSGSHGETLAEIAHDARNLVTALGLYCDLLEESGVLAAKYLHYASELRLVAAASRRLVEKLLALDGRVDCPVPAAAAAPLQITPVPEPARLSVEPRSGLRPEGWQRTDLMPADPVANLAAELLANRNLLAALAGPAIALTVDADEGSRPVRLRAEDLTRILVNLVKNAAEAMPGGGRISIGLHEFHAGTEIPPWVILTIEDNGPGIPAPALERIFDSGFTTRSTAETGAWPAARRGLGLAITRSIVEEAGGRIHALNRLPSGARFEIELPVWVRSDAGRSGPPIP